MLSLVFSALTSRSSSNSSRQVNKESSDEPVFYLAYMVMSRNSLSPVDNGVVWFSRSRPTLRTPWTVAQQPLCPWDFPLEILEWVAIPSSGGSSWTQGSNLGLLHFRQILDGLSHQQSPVIVAIMWLPLRSTTLARHPSKYLTCTSSSFIFVTALGRRY